VSEAVTHLAQHHKYDEDEMWCGSSDWPRTREIQEATCIECLRAAAGYGEESHDRKVELQSQHIRDMLRRQGFE
jgi:hypothetical protein